MPFPQEYLLSTFVIYNGHTDPLRHLGRFKHQAGNDRRRHLTPKTVSTSPEGTHSIGIAHSTE